MVGQQAIRNRRAARGLSRVRPVRYRVAVVHRLIISAPFGNYVQPTNAVATLGTFTAHARPGRLWRVLKTVRYYPRLRAWVNKIGLRNPGIGWLGERARKGRIRVDDKIVSVHGFDEGEWHIVLEHVAALRPLAVELNMSCPNVGAIEWPRDLFARALATGVPVVVKLPPVRYETMFQEALRSGVRAFHCCNTLPVPAGGVSGQPLKPVALDCIRRVRELAGATQVRIVGGGGVRSPQDVDDYAALGVVAIAVGTKVMNPLYLVTHRPLAPIVARAERALAGRPFLVDAAPVPAGVRVAEAT
jgi:dihydroorotate dehydrogenase